jgi:MFS family permease
MMLAVFGVYVTGIAGLSLAWSYESLLAFRLLASLSLGAEWGISHTYLAERVSGERRYRFSALLQFSILGGLLAAMMARYALPAIGWRWLFAASIVPVIALTAVRWGALTKPETGNRKPERGGLWSGIRVNVAPGMLLGALVVRRWGVARALAFYAGGLLVLSGWAWLGASARSGLVFALVLPLLNGIPFGLMGAWFNEVFGAWRTMLSGAAYNLGRILAGFAPVLITALGLHENGRYFLFSALLGLGVLALAGVIGVVRRA